MSNSSKKVASRIRRRKSIRKKIRGSAARPRLAVFRSAKHIYAQVIDDDAGVTLASASSLGIEKADDEGGKLTVAASVGELLGKRALEASVSAVVFDRGGFLYHGRVAALAEGARKAGLQF